MAGFPPKVKHGARLDATFPAQRNLSASPKNPANVKPSSHPDTPPTYQQPSM